MNCPYCKALIDDDSLYCDQCAGEIFVCSVCGRPGKGKRCIYDGQVMLKPNESASAKAVDQTPPLGAPTATPTQASSPAAQTTPLASAPQTAQPTTTVTPQVPYAAVPQASSQSSGTTRVSQVSSASGVLHLVNTTLHFDLKPNPGDVAGRRSGPFVGVFGQFPQVSGNHARFDRGQNGWTVTDLGSTNGTRWNGQLLSPNVAQVLSDKGTLVLADIAIQVQISAEEASGTVRV